MTTAKKISTALVVLPLLLLAACGPRLDTEGRLELARGQLQQGDAASASIHLRNVLQEDPSHLEARILFAEATFMAGDHDSAAKEYLRAIDLGGDIDQFRLQLVESLVRAGGVEEALRFTAPEQIGDAPELLFWRAHALLRAGRLEEAKSLLETLQAPAALRDRAQVGLARVELAHRRPEGALAILAPLAESLAGDVEYWETLAQAQLLMGQPDEAVTAYRRAAEVVVDPLGTRRFMIRAAEAEALLAAGRLEEARALATALQAQAERNPAANYLMSRVELQAGNAEQALAFAQAVLAAQPDSSIGQMMAGAASMALGQTAAAERYLERAIASDPGNTAARKLLAQVRLGLESPERALEALRPALAEPGADPSVAALAGMASVRAGDPDAAVTIFRRQLEQNPQDEEARLMLAVSLMSAGRTEEALATLGGVAAGEGVIRQRADLIGIAANLQSGDLPAARALAARVGEAGQGNTAIYSTLGAVFQGAGQLDDAAGWFERALAAAPDNNAAAYNLGRIYAARGELDAAAQQFDDILARAPDSAVVLTARAQLDWAGGEPDAAIARLQRARAADPADGGSRFVLTQYLVAQGRSAEAVPVATEAVEIGPNASPWVNALGVALLGAGRPAEALPHFERAHEINPLEARYLFNAARANAAQGSLETARTQLVNALALEPENPNMLITLVEIERRAGRPEAASRALARAERALPADDPRVPLLRGELLVDQQRYADAERAFAEAERLGIGNRAVLGQFEARRRGGLPDPSAPLRRWLEHSPRDPAVRALLAEYHLAGADHPAAIREYQQLLEIAPDNALFLNNLAWLYGEAGDPRGLELARRAHARAPDNPMIADTLGWILHLNGEHAEALELLARAVAGAPQAGDVRYRYAVVLAETGDAAAARREARAVLADTGAANYHESAQALLKQLGEE